MRDDPDAFGLYEAAHTAGERLTEAMEEFGAAEWAGDVGDEAMARFVALVGGEGGTVAEAAMRRATAVTIRRVARTSAGGTEGGRGGGIFGDLFCPIYRWLSAAAPVLREARQKESRDKRAHVRSVVNQLLADDEPITFTGVARAANVSHWLVHADSVRRHIKAARRRQGRAAANDTRVGAKAPAG
ncbi:hypothetical protein SAZ11_36970 [Streptomyces sp. FXJ1.4098]|nr:hypothetical protein [Streptomyces sp. FXJ1.4098]